MESKKVSAKKRLKEYVIITFAASLYGFATAILIDPNNIAPGGITGLAIALNRLIPINTGTWFMLMNVPLLILAVWKFGIRFTISTIYATTIIGWATNLTDQYLGAYVIQDKILGVTIGSAVTALAMGLVFKCHATSGGTDIIIKLLRIKYPHIKTGMLYILTDVFVLIFAGIVFRDVAAALYSFISVMVTSLTLDFVLYGRDGAKLIYIISDHPDIITARLLEELDIGATHVFAQGAYSGEKKKVIMCAIKKRLSPLAEEIVRDEDPNAFMIVTSASEIFGEGYKSYFDERM
ncbi:YitT family protein [Butyrivibrio proteoclasticus]|uniref:YitT family protein n=1 Tax=Butyrivibrio proteoclasticus TaxID=43305 RepID=UPI00047D15B9|nr:YitT family protein [Butyrivibrio proteoclasticus]